MHITVKTIDDALDLLRSAPHEVCALITTDVYAHGMRESTLVSVPDNAEQAMEVADTLARTGAVSLIVIDASLAAFGTRRGRMLLAEVERRSPAVAIVLAY